MKSTDSDCTPPAPPTLNLFEMLAFGVMEPYSETTAPKGHIFSTFLHRHVIISDNITQFNN